MSRSTFLQQGAGLIALAAVIGLSVAAGVNEQTTASVADALHPPTNTASSLPASQAISTVHEVEAATPSTTVTIQDNGLTILAEVHTITIGDALKELGITLSETDLISPSLEDQVVPGGTISIQRARTITLIDGTEEQHISSAAQNVQDLLTSLNKHLKEEDSVHPKPDAQLPEDGVVTITRVTTEEQTEEESIPFETILTEDNTLSLGTTVVDQAGENGKKIITYKITMENGQEIDRIQLNEEIISTPTDEHKRTGTYVEPKPEPKPTPKPSPENPTEDITHGRATYYWGPTLAASNTLPKGTRVRVTNTDNRASLEVTIDDWGGFSHPTVIDLRSDLFEQLGAPLSAGVIPVSVEVLH